MEHAVEPAGSVVKIHSDQRLPVVEANTQRVYARLVGLRSDISKSASLKLLWQVAEALLPQKRVGVFNQAAMELGKMTIAVYDGDKHSWNGKPDCEVMGWRSDDGEQPFSTPSLRKYMFGNAGQNLQR